MNGTTGGRLIRALLGAAGVCQIGFVVAALVGSPVTACDLLAVTYLLLLPAVGLTVHLYRTRNREGDPVTSVPDAHHERATHWAKRAEDCALDAPMRANLYAFIANSYATLALREEVARVVARLEREDEEVRP